MYFHSNVLGVINYIQIIVIYAHILYTFNTYTYIHTSVWMGRHTHLCSNKYFYTILILTASPATIALFQRGRHWRTLSYWLSSFTDLLKARNAQWVLDTFPRKVLRLYTAGIWDFPSGNVCGPTESTKLNWTPWLYFWSPLNWIPAMNCDHFIRSWSTRKSSE